MAKSIRASIGKRNRAKLRATVFGPVVDERTARLSAKLQELASQPKPTDQEKSKTATEATEMDTQGKDTKANREGDNEDMDIDSTSLKNNTRSRSQRSGRIQKRQKKARSFIVFRAHPLKNKKFSKKK